MKEGQDMHIPLVLDMHAAQNFIGLAIGNSKTTSTVCGHSSKACHEIDCEVSYELTTIFNYFFPRD